MEYYNIQIASRISGVSPHTIRAWEKRYQALTPKRNENGRRLYNDQEIERLTLLAKLSQMGNSIGQIARLKDEELVRLYQKLSESENIQIENIAPIKQLGQSSQVNIQESLANISMAISAYKIDIFRHEIEKAKSCLEPKSFLLHVVSPLLKEILNLRTESQITSDQEQTMIAILRYYVGVKPIYGESSKAGHCFICMPNQEWLDIESLIAANLFHHYKIPYLVAAPNLSIKALADSAKAFDAHTIIITLSSNPQSLENYDIYSFVEKLQREYNQTAQWWMVGKLPSHKQTLLANLGVRTFASLEILDQHINKKKSTRSYHASISA